MYSLPQRAVAEALGTALLLMVVVGSGIMGERLAGGNAAIALLANSLATGAGLLCLILLFAPLSGAHFNPAVTLVMTARGELGRADAGVYIAAQIAGAFAGVAATHLMFELPLFSASLHVRAGAAQGFSEFIATFGLLAVILGSARHQPRLTPCMVAAYITAAYWFTASTSFANPAVTFARAASNTFAGIHPGNVPLFVLMQLLGAVSAALLMHWLLRTPAEKLLPRAATPTTSPEDQP